MNKSYFPWNAIREERPSGRASFVLESNWELWKVKMVLMTVSVSILSADDNKLFITIKPRHGPHYIAPVVPCRCIKLLLSLLAINLRIQRPSNYNCLWVPMSLIRIVCRWRWYVICQSSTRAFTKIDDIMEWYRRGRINSPHIGGLPTYLSGNETIND